MKCFLLLAIFAIVQYQEATGFPRNVANNEHRKWSHVYTYTPSENRQMNMEDLHIPLYLDSLGKEGRFLSFPIKPFNLSDALHYVSEKFDHLKDNFEKTIKQLEEAVKKYELEHVKDHITKDKNTKDQSTFENAESGNKMQINAAQTASVLNQLPPTIGRSVRLPRKESFSVQNVPLHVYNYLRSKLELIKIRYQDMIQNVQNIINDIKNLVTKTKIVDQLPFGNTTTGDKTEINTTQATFTPTSDETTVNQQYTSNKNDDKTEKLDDKEEKLDNEEIFKNSEEFHKDPENVTEDKTIQKDQSTLKSIESSDETNK